MEIQNLNIKKMKLMKNLLSLLFVLVSLTISQAQIKVVAPNGDVGVGNSAPDEKLHVTGNLKIDGEEFNEGFECVKTGASASALFNRTDRAAMALGGGYHASGVVFDQVYDFQVRSTTRGAVTSRLIANGAVRFHVEGSNGFVGINTNVPTHNLSVDGTASKPGGGDWATFSDRRLKNNIKPFRAGLEEVMQLKPVSFQYNGKANISDTRTEYVGVIAQDFEEVAPYAVKEQTIETIEEVEEDGIWKERVTSVDDYLTIDASSIRYMLVNAVQEQQAIIESQEERIQDLEEKIALLADLIETRDGEVIKTNLESPKAGLGQNVPNPFENTTVIAYDVPENVQNAMILIYDLDGKVLKQINIPATGRGTVEITEAEIVNGTYTYSLVANGKILDTKKMIKAK